MKILVAFPQEKKEAVMKEQLFQSRAKYSSDTSDLCGVETLLDGFSQLQPTRFLQATLSLIYKKFP